MGREFQENICTMRQLRHPWQHMRRAVLGLPVGLALPMAQPAWAQPARGAGMALEGTRMHSRPREGLSVHAPSSQEQLET